jgi:hypothetical protein
MAATAAKMYDLCKTIMPFGGCKDMNLLKVELR